MKLVIFALAFISPLSLWAGSVHQCEDAQGNMSFSSEPCPDNASALSTLNSQPGKNRRLKNTAIKRIIINNQQDFNQFVNTLSFNNMSDVLRGLETNRFHGVKLSYLLAQDNIQYESNPLKNETINYSADIKRGKRKNSFSVSYALNVKGKSNHPFLNLSNEKIIFRMQSLGFGKPETSQNIYSWDWRYGNMDCQFDYKRSDIDSNKYFKYACSETGY
ncbi:MAG: DUF4124 domain-containing protein [Bermanella sp.]